ncbi:hypothetical protein [Streptomyces sp. CNQ085]|uniref:hypothetical protein n=1 Tax=Streptomyces sp. CNQ085 TaxID=2886944 RepID=UPI001F506FCE|nr:hypothetical protein [Streptomyces sp. CNQ085]MCI0387043.1 hypothetical protein [Streptomyces sp. CNQ085]
MSAAVGLFDRRPGWDGTEGPRPMLTIAPGALAIGWPDIARRERTAERARETARQRASDLGRYRAEYVDDPAPLEPTRVVSEWSRKSRSRMTRKLAELDYGPLLKLGLKLPMTTLTYPGDWEVVAPTGKAVKRHLLTFYKRFARAWGFEWLGIWKLEFQRRGAPHIHLWGPEPEGTAGELRRLTQRRYRPAVGDGGLEYREWLSAVWADIVAHPDPEQRRLHQGAGTAVNYREGARMRDPRRLAVYFTKHGSYSAKEYQNRVPEAWQAPGAGPGRFWGYRGLESAAAGVELDPVAAVWAGRILRRYARAQGVTQQRTVRRTRGGVPVPTDRVIGLAGAQYAEPTRTRYRTVRRRVVRLGNGRGFLCVNDGPSLAASLARALAEPTAPLPPAERAWGRS